MVVTKSTGPEVAYFAPLGPDADGLVTPLPWALSGWGADHLRGSAVTGLLARAAERAASHRGDLRPARITVDLHSAADATPAASSSVILREGRGLLLVDSEMYQGERVVARARTVFLTAGDGGCEPAGWASGSPSVPPATMTPVTPEGRLFFSEGVGWSPEAADHASSRRKQVWCRPIPVVSAESPTPFQIAASVADLTSLTVHWNERGVERINADVSVVLARIPEGGDVGLSARWQAGDPAASVGAAELYDRAGVFGYTQVTALARSERVTDTVGQLMRGRDADGESGEGGQR